jgi:uncharacterized protein (DUF2249 family)
MDNLVIASTAGDADAAVAVEQHHAALAGALGLRVERLLTAAELDDGAAERCRTDLVEWCRRELVPHALAEEKGMYPAAQETAEGRFLVEGMLAEHGTIVGLVDEIAAATVPVRAAAAGRALQVLFESHLAKENDLVLPLLAATPQVSLADLLEGMHELLGLEHHEAQEASNGGCDGHSCSCGEVDGPELPELDARAIPHAIRHATIFGALDSVAAGGGLVLIAPHDPLPLLAQVEQRSPGIFDVDYLERGPEAWRLRFARTA